MAQEPLEVMNSAKKVDSQRQVVKDIVLGIFLFVGMNLALLVIIHIDGLEGIFPRMYIRFFGDSIGKMSVFYAARNTVLFLSNALLFIYLIIIKRPRMLIGLLAGIPALFMILFFLWLMLCIFVTLVFR